MRGLERWDLVSEPFGTITRLSEKKKILLNSGYQFETIGASSADLKPSDLRVFAVSHKGKASELKEDLVGISLVSSAYYQVVRSRSGEEILQPRSGKRLSVAPGGIEGWVDLFTTSGDTLQIGGWAADTKWKQASREILLFTGDTSMYRISTGVTRIDIAKSYQSEALVSSGFYCTLSLSSAGLSDRLGSLRFFAISAKDGKATEIFRPQDRVSRASEGGFSLYSSAGLTDGFITSRAGDTIRIAPGGIAGAIDVLDTIRGEVHIAGWAADLKRREAVRSVLIFLKNKNLLQVTTGVPRPDLAHGQARKNLRYSGFDHKFPISLLGGLSDLGAIRVFAFSESEKEVAEIVSSSGQPSSRPSTAKEILEAGPVPRYVLRKGSRGGESLFSPDGKEITVIPDSIEGHVDAAEVGDSIVSVQGWAADVEPERRARSIVVLAGDVNVVSVATGAFRPDLAAIYGRGEVDRAGFDCRIPLRLLGKPSDSTAVRFLAIGGDGTVASELVYPVNYPFKH